ncbi:alpha/beta fold hydrolase [Amycolatopsis magusensis]|uniref:Pimeloyl-ACP methyl ester carboxylesterase n=1 Tax=Amycolatopsis magusensis TaxID=882444 RepID=A0ABS4Q6T7_9PSEU|nr:alpha/beta hydrolase [Amycolatopsis magusensis]MBP2186804.1 pimeloyl-ACP methyl ester carboxylesterase [Amycolatopsis magusensis]
MGKTGAFTDDNGRDDYFAVYRETMTQGPPPAAVLDIETSFGTTRVYRHGENGPPIMLLHGLLAGAPSCAPFWAPLSAAHTVYTLDILGEGGHSVQTEPITSHAERAHCLDEVLDALHLTGVHLVGMSSGGWQATNYALHHPARLATLTLLDPTTVTANFSFGALRQGLLLKLFPYEWRWRRFFQWAAGQDISGDPAVRLVRALTRVYRPAVPFQTCPPEAELRAMEVPTLAIFSGRSAVHDSATAAARARAWLPRSEVEVWPDLGHYFSPADFRRMVERVLHFVDVVQA